MNDDMHRQWEEKEKLATYEFSVEMGEEMFAKAFKNGKTYAACFPNGGMGVRQNYPYFDEGEGKVITLELALNRCREANGEAPLSYVKDEMAALTAYMAFTSRGKPFDIKIPNDPRALAAYQKGEEYFYARRGQLNFSCASCHVQNPGNHIRTEVLAPALGIVAAMPIYRSEWNGMRTMSRRLVTCHSQRRGENSRTRRRLRCRRHPGQRGRGFGEGVDRASQGATDRLEGRRHSLTRSIRAWTAEISCAGLASPPHRALRRAWRWRPTTISTTSAP